MIRDAHDRRALALAALASVILLTALLLPLTWVVGLLVVLGCGIGIAAAASSLRRLPSRRA